MKKRFLPIVPFTLLTVFWQFAAAEPLGSSFTYQGVLQDGGSPANGLYDFEFALFDAASGGVESGFPMFLDDVEVSNGVFTVELEFGPTPFDGEQQWIDIAVRDGNSTGGLTGLLPRQKLTVAPYALHAQGVALDSVGSSELIDNSVTASKIAIKAVGSAQLANDAVSAGKIAANAVSARELADNSVTADAVAAGAIRNSELARNAVMASNIDRNAVGRDQINSLQVQERVTGDCVVGTFVTSVDQDGTVNCGTDQTGLDAAGAVAAILANDGPSSGLDADLLDGQEPGEILAANRIGTEIDSVPIVINQPGRYFFTSNLSYSGNDQAILVTTDDAFIDMNGFVLSGPGASGNDADGIQVQSGRRGLTVINGTIRNFGSQGIVSSSSAADGNHVSNVRILFTGSVGLWLSGDGNVVADCYFKSNGVFGLRIGGGVVRGTTIVDALDGGIFAGPIILVDTSFIDIAGTPISASPSGFSERVIVVNN